MIDRKYKSPARHNRVKTYFTSLQVRQYEENEMNVSVSQSKLYKLVLRLSRQVLPSLRGDTHRIEIYLKSCSITSVDTRTSIEGVHAQFIISAALR